MSENIAPSGEDGHKGHLLSGTVESFCKLPLPSIPKCSQLDVDQDGPKLFYSPGRILTCPTV